MTSHIGVSLTWRMKVKTKTIATIVVFAALAIALNLSPLKIPAPYMPFLIYQIWEIPIVAAFLLYGTGVGSLITVINTMALLALFPGDLPTGPFYNMAAVLSMLLGVGIVKILVEKHASRHEAIVAALLTGSGVISRTALMTLVNYVCLRFPAPVGYGLPEAAIIAYIPLIAVFNATLSLYTIPMGYSLSRAVRSYVKT
jgi:riboflavin transporter FmnP